MAKLKSYIGSIVSKMRENGLVESVGSKDTAAINRDVSEAFSKAKSESEAIQRQSRAYVARIELTHLRKTR